MKKLINILSILGIVVAPCAIAYLYLQDIPALQAMAPAKEKKAIAPEAFPLNQVRFVDFRADEGSLKRLTERERMDQLRDWLLFTVVSNKNLSTRELKQSLYDLPTVRYGYMKPVSNFEYGQTRSLYIGKGQVVALLPKGLSQQERMDELAHIADKHRKDTGEIPKSLEVFEYEINRDKQFALLTRREVLDAQKLFSKGEYGYHEAEIKSLDDLKHFMSQVDDVTFTRVKNSSLILGGRKIFSRQYRGIRLEDVAAIWQSEKNIQERLAQFDARWQEKAKNLSPEALEQARQEALEEGRKLKLVNGSGFSLDPSYDYRALENSLAKAEPALRVLTADGVLAVSQQELEAVKLGLSKKDVIPYLTLVDKLKKNVDKLRLGPVGTVEDVNDFLRSPKTSSFQAARYDGDLQGTEVGMVLFYTDLLAKLWALDFLGTAPQEKYIPDFKPLTKVQVSSIYEPEIKQLLSTRLWFGTQDKGFQVADGGNSMFFARNATRIYAASSNPLQPGAETAASADTSAFLSWWNDHYEEVARYEPEYERLNQIMKWSLIVSWLNKANQGSTLEFLQGVQVKRDNWFPDWAQANSDQLKFQRWDRVSFYPRGDKDTQTEAMPLLVSDLFKQFGEEKFFSGGVSLADKKLFEGRAALPKTSQVDKLSLRSNLKYDAVESVDNSLNLNTLEGTAYQLKNLEQDLGLVTAKAKEGAKLRSPESELINLEVSHNISRTDSGIEIQTSFGGTELGSFSTSRTNNGFVAGWLGRDIDEGQSLAMNLSRDARDVETVLIDTPDIESVVKLPTKPPSYLVKKPYWSHWLKVANDETGSINIPPGWKSRVGSPEDGSRNIVLDWVDDATVNGELARGTAQSIRYQPPKKGVTDNGAFAEKLRSKKYDAIAQELVQDPMSFLVAKEAHFNAEVKQIDKFLQAKNYAKAAQDIDGLINFYGRKPELMIRKAVVEISRGRVNIKRVTLDGSGIVLLDGKTNFLDEVNGVLGRSDGKGKFVVRNNEKAFYYVQDTPGLNNLDWNQPIEQTIPLISAKARVYRVLPGEIGTVKLSAIGFGDTSSFTQASTQSGPNINNGLRSVRSAIGQDDECKQEEKEQGKEKPCDRQSEQGNSEQEKPIYIVISSENS